jgi:hypothetical protein
MLYKKYWLPESSLCRSRPLSERLVQKICLSCRSKIDKLVLMSGSFAPVYKITQHMKLLYISKSKYGERESDVFCRSTLCLKITTVTTTVLSAKFPSILLGKVLLRLHVVLCSIPVPGSLLKNCYFDPLSSMLKFVCHCLKKAMKVPHVRLKKCCVESEYQSPLWPRNM